jgi:hypothetical protein
MIEDSLTNDIMLELQNRYVSQEARRNLRLNDSLIKEILDIVETKGYEILTMRDFPTSNFSSTAIEQFESPIRQWAQSGDDYYIPTEQILRDLINLGWVIRPPKGV